MASRSAMIALFWFAVRAPDRSSNAVIAVVAKALVSSSSATRLAPAPRPRRKSMRSRCRR